MSERSARSRMGRAALVVSAGILLSRLLGLVRQIVLSTLLGNTSSGDVYEAAFVIPDFMFYLMAGGYLAITFIPILSRYLVEDDEAGGNAAFAAIFRPLAIAMITLTVVAMATTDRLVEAVYVGFPDVFSRLFGDLAGAQLSSEALAEVAQLTRIILPAQVLFVLGSLFMAVQYTHERFLIPTLAPVIYNLGIIVGGLIGHGRTSLPAAGFIWGALGGAFVGNFALQWWGARRVGWVWVRSVPWRHPAVGQYLAMAIPLMLAQSIVVLDEQLVRVFGQLGDDGSIFALGRARRLNMLPVGVIAQAAGVAAYPYLAQLAAGDHISELSDTVKDALRYVLFASAAAAAAVIALATPAVRVALQHGNFTSEGTILTASALVFYGLSIPAWGAQQIYGRAFYARRQMWTPVIVGTAGLVLALPLFKLGFERFGVSGLALASSVALTLYSIALAVIWHRRTGFGQARQILSAFGRSVVAAVPAGLAAWLTVQGISDAQVPSFQSGILALGGGLAVLVAIFLLVGRWLGSPELDVLFRRSRTSRSR